MSLSLLIAAMVAAQAPQQAADQPKSADSEKVICKRDSTTGSRVKKTRVCMTARQWDRAAQDAQANTQDYIDGANRMPPPPG